MNCKIIRDLLPLYHDEVASIESRELVGDHLKTCEECRKMLEDIRENVKTKNAPDTEQPMADGFKVLKKRLRRETVSNVAIAIVCAAVVVSALVYGVFFYERPVPYSEVARSITQPIHSALDFITNVRGHSSIDVLQKGDALYICYSDTLWSRYIVKPSRQLKISSIRLLMSDMPELPKIPERRICLNGLFFQRSL